MDADCKQCTKCGAVKALDGFPPLKRSGDGRRPQCRGCVNAAHREYMQRPEAKAKKADRDRSYYHDPDRHDDLLQKQRDRYANPEVKAAASEKERLRRQDPEYREKKRRAAAAWYAKPENKVRAALNGREYMSTPGRREKDRVRKSEWNKSPAGRAYFASRQRAVRSTPDGAVANATRKLLHRVLEATTMPKSGPTVEQLGYTAEALMARMQAQFKPGMSWANHGDWHIDHKKPVAEFLRQGITEPKTINMLCNLQPLWAAENIAKGDTWSTLVAANENVKTAEAA